MGGGLIASSHAATEASLSGQASAASLAAAGVAEQLAAKLVGMGLTPATPPTEQQRLAAAAMGDEPASPRTVASLARASATSAGDTDTASPRDPGSAVSISSASASRTASVASSSQAGSAQQRAGRATGLGCSSLTPVNSVGDLEQPPLEVDLEFLCDRLKRGPLTGQVVAWGWDQAARLCLVRRAMPNQLFSSLWAATEACLFRMTAQDVVEILESWLTITRQCARHFRLALHTVAGMATYTLPAAVKRMSERQLGQVAGMCRDIALHRNEADLTASSALPSQAATSPRIAAAKRSMGLTAGMAGASPRDQLQPVFALVAAEAAWRVNNAARYVSPATVDAILSASKAWSWRTLRQRDNQRLAVLKEATAQALALLEMAQRAAAEAAGDAAGGHAPAAAAGKRRV